MPDFAQRELVNDRILDLNGGDPFEDVVREAEAHRATHGRACGLFPAGPHVMRLVSTLVRASQPKRILDLGAGFGYSALWLAASTGPDAIVEAIDRFPDHISRAEAYARQTRLSGRVRFTVGEVSAVLARLEGPYDFIHDDAWFATEPPYFERMLALLRPGGTLTMPNWFLLEDAITGDPRRDWAEFAGERWQESTLDYARRLATDPRIHVTWCVSPPLAVAVRRVE